MFIRTVDLTFDFNQIDINNTHCYIKPTLLHKQYTFTVLHLQASNTALQKQVKDEKEVKVKLAAEVTDLHNQIQKMKIERTKLLSSQSEKVRSFSTEN